MPKHKVRDKILHVYMTEDEYAFLKICSEQLDCSMAQALLQLADFDNRRREYMKANLAQSPGGINFSQLPDREEGEY